MVKLSWNEKNNWKLIFEFAYITLDGINTFLVFLYLETGAGVNLHLCLIMWFKMEILIWCQNFLMLFFRNSSILFLSMFFINHETYTVKLVSTC